MDRDLLIDEGRGPRSLWTLVLAHGAGQGMRSPFMETSAGLLADRGIRTVRFEFPYMVAMGRDGRRRPPDRADRLLDSWNRILDRLAGQGLGTERLLVGGKSMGGRIACELARGRALAGLVCLGFPFHPPGQPERVRSQCLAAIEAPTLICQGTRDPFGRPEEVANYGLSRTVTLVWIQGGEHSFRPGNPSPEAWRRNLALAADAVAAFAAGLDKTDSQGSA